MHVNPLKLKTAGLFALVVASPSLFADELPDNHAYAILQQCLATAELPANHGSELDRYCIDSYLATVRDNQR
jgi:hypothetical protein